MHKSKKNVFVLRLASCYNQGPTSFPKAKDAQKVKVINYLAGPVDYSKFAIGMTHLSRHLKHQFDPKIDLEADRHPKISAKTMSYLLQLWTEPIYSDSTGFPMFWFFLSKSELVHFRLEWIFESVL